MDCASTDFLESLLDQMMYIPPPILELENNLPVQQNSKLLSLPDKVLRSILSSLPLKHRIATVASVCKRLGECTKSSIESVEFYKEGLDGLEDNKLKYFLSLYGQNIKHLNFDLFRSSNIEECTQWIWRASVVSCVSLCPKLEELTVLICNRHRLRDNDLLTIFQQAPHLNSLQIDAQFLKGHCFKNAPQTLQKLELEVCSRLTFHVMKYIYNLKQLKILCLSQLLCLRDSIIYGISSNMQNLEELSLVIHGEQITFPELSATGLAMLGKLRNLKHLALEGIPAVTDKFFEEIGNPKKPLRNSLESFSVAFCNNFSNIGLQLLAQYPYLRDLNLEGCSKRDISLGLEMISNNSKLERLLVAENCFVREESLLRTIQNSTHLCLLDITGNPRLSSWNFAANLVSNRKVTPFLQLIVLTDRHTPWNVIPQENWQFPFVKVVHVLPQAIPPNDFYPNTVLSCESPSHLTPGVLSARLRRGNRCRLLCAASTLSLYNDDKENSSPNSTPDQRTPSPLVQFDENKITKLGNYKSSQHLISANSLHSFPQTSLFEPNSSVDLFPLQAAFAGINMDMDPLLFGSDYAYNMMPMISDQSLEASIPIDDETIQEGKVSQNGGAPRPPIEIPEQPTIRYNRGPRSKRKSVGYRLKPRNDNGAVFTANDFPPLGSS